VARSGYPLVLGCTVEIVPNTSPLVREAGAKDIEDGVVVGTNAGIGEDALDWSSNNDDARESLSGLDFS